MLKRLGLFCAGLVMVALGIALPVWPQDVPAETYTLPNGLTVILHEDHRLPQVAVNLWYAVGAKDEAKGRTGFAHLFEHLMFMGTDRVPQGQFDRIMESGGGANNASTAEDRTNYYSWGPSTLLPTLLWLDADRMEGLGKAMTQEKLDLQRSVVRNERRQSYENQPYGKAWLMIPEALYPEGHPYHHPVIGSHEDLEAATLKDVQDFFATYYVPGNASLVVAGDFERAAVKKVIADTFGAVPAQPLPEHRSAAPVVLDREIRRMATDKVRYPMLWLVWPSPRAFDPGDAEMSLTAAVLSADNAGRLYQRLVLQDRSAQSVVVYQHARDLGSEFTVQVRAAEGADLERIKRTVLEEMDRYKREGPTEAELKRVKASAESHFLRRVEDLQERADMLNAYYHAFGDPDGFRRDLAATTSASADSLKSWARKVLGEGRLDLRILPVGAVSPGADLSRRPADFPPAPVHPPVPEATTLANGMKLYVVSRPGTGLFSGVLVVDGGERLVPKEKAGLAALSASLLTDGAGSLDAEGFAEAAASLGASIEAGSSWHAFTVRVDGLSSKLAPTLDLFTDAVVRPTLSEKDFSREKELALAGIRSRVERPETVAVMASRAMIFGRDDPRGRPRAGYAATVQAIELKDVRECLPRLLRPAGASLVFVGDFDPQALKAALDRRLGGWRPPAESLPPPLEPLVQPAPGRLVLVDRPGAPQTVLYMMRPVAAAGGPDGEALRDSLNTLFGGAFTSRLMQNIREKHGYSYGAGSSLWREADQFMLGASSSVQTAVTGAALAEFRREFGAIASGNVTADELTKANRTVRFDLVSSAATASSLSDTLGEIIASGRPLDSVGREIAALDRLDLSGVNATAASGLFDWSKLLVVLVGDKAAVLPQLKAAGFPEPALVNPEGAPM